MAAIRVVIWPKRGLPQLGKMPWYDECHYKQWGIDLGDDPETMDADAYANYLEMEQDEAIVNSYFRTEEEDEEDLETE